MSSATRIDRRELSVSLRTPALGRPVVARVLLPSGYAEHPDRRYPTLYLYTGTGGHAADWTNSGDVEGITAHEPLIVVMPDVGFGTGGGWFSNWRDHHTSLGPNQWETFEVGELIPWVDANFRTRANRDGRAIAGLSQGGFGSMVAATRHPDMFVSAAALSGAVDIAYGSTVSPAGHAFVTSTTIADGVPPFAIFGSPSTDEANWQGHDPTTLVGNLRGMDVRLYTGNGLPGPYDTPATDALGTIEVLAHLETHEMYAHAKQLRVPIHLRDYGAGTHSFPYWQRDLRWYLPHLIRDFAARRAAPRPTSYDATARNWSQWGWSVAITRAVRDQFSHLRRAGRRGFRLLGRGRARVRTPAFYPSGTDEQVTVHHEGQVAHRRVRVDRRGRLTLRVSLPARVIVTGEAATRSKR